MDIIFFGGHYWDDKSWFRKQQFASRFAEIGHRVFYVEDTKSIVRLNKSSKNHYIKTRVEKVSDNLIKITPSALLPYPGNSLTRKTFNLKFKYDLKKIMKEFDSKDSLIWFNRIEYADIIEKMAGTKVLDLCDDLPQYFKLFNNDKRYKVQLKNIINSLSIADLTVVSAYKLKEKYSKYSKGNTVVVPNGHDISVRKLKEVNPAIIRNGKPIIGFIGTLFKFIDDEFLEYVISQRPEYLFYFVGKVQNDFPIEKIKKYNNVKLLGLKPKDTIPSFIKSFDVAINPFKKSEVNDSVNPVKIFEYLALGKNIVSTNMYSLMQEPISKHIYFAESKEEFLKGIDESLSSNIEITQSEIDEYSWDNLFKKLLVHLNNELKIEL